MQRFTFLRIRIRHRPNGAYQRTLSSTSLVPPPDAQFGSIDAYTIAINANTLKETEKRDLRTESSSSDSSNVTVQNGSLSSSANTRSELSITLGESSSHFRVGKRVGIVLALVLSISKVEMRVNLPFGSCSWRTWQMTRRCNYLR